MTCSKFTADTATTRSKGLMQLPSWQRAVVPADCCMPHYCSLSDYDLPTSILWLRHASSDCPNKTSNCEALNDLDHGLPGPWDRSHLCVCGWQPRKHSCAAGCLQCPRACSWGLKQLQKLAGKLPLLPPEVLSLHSQPPCSVLMCLSCRCPAACSKSQLSSSHWLPLGTFSSEHALLKQHEHSPALC